jgi:hypothetical protein
VMRSSVDGSDLVGRAAVVLQRLGLSSTANASAPLLGSSPQGHHRWSLARKTRPSPLARRDLPQHTSTDPAKVVICRLGTPQRTRSPLHLVQLISRDCNGTTLRLQVVLLIAALFHCRAGLVEYFGVLRRLRVGRRLGIHMMIRLTCHHGLRPAQPVSKTCGL